METLIKNTKGFTIIELVLVLTILGATFGFSVFAYQNSQVRADVNAEVSGLVAQLRLAQSNAASGQNNTSHGIHFETDSYTAFSGISYNPADTNNFIVPLPSQVTIANISLNGNGSEVIFTTPDGTTTTYGTLDMTSTAIGKTVTITINPIGTINY